jgi:hypothetical protein
MSDLGTTYPDEKKISKATKMVILTSIDKRKYLCDYHYNVLVDSGVAMLSHSSILEEFGNVLCDECAKER